MHQEEATQYIPKEGEKGDPSFSCETGKHSCYPPYTQLKHNYHEREKNNNNGNNNISSSVIIIVIIIIIVIQVNLLPCRASSTESGRRRKNRTSSLVWLWFEPFWIYLVPAFPSWMRGCPKFQSDRKVTPCAFCFLLILHIDSLC